jgi:hypothetical protein
MSVFSLSKLSRSNITTRGGKVFAFVADEDGTVVLDVEHQSMAEALDQVGSVQKQLRALRAKHTGVESLIALRAEYRAAKDRADALRDQFAAAKEAMQSPVYANHRAKIKP